MSPKFHQDTIDIFDHDASANEGYVYTTTERYSTVVTRERTIRLLQETGAFTGQRVLDVGCGDGFYSQAYAQHGQAQRWLGCDPAFSAIQVATRKHAQPPQL